MPAGPISVSILCETLMAATAEDASIAVNARRANLCAFYLRKGDAAIWQLRNAPIRRFLNPSSFGAQLLRLQE